MGFAHFSCKIVWPDWIGPKPNPVLDGDELDVSDRFCFLDSRISSGSRISNKASSRIEKAGMGLNNLRCMSPVRHAFIGQRLNFQCIGKIDPFMRLRILDVANRRYAKSVTVPTPIFSYYIVKKSLKQLRSLSRSVLSASSVDLTAVVVK